MQHHSFRSGLIATYIDRRTRHRHVRIGHRQIGTHWRAIDEAGKLLNIIEPVTDLPEQQIGVSTRADEAVAPDLYTVRERPHNVPECSLAAFSLLLGQPTPGGVNVIERELHDLPSALGLLWTFAHGRPNRRFFPFALGRPPPSTGRSFVRKARRWTTSRPPLAEAYPRRRRTPRVAPHRRYSAGRRRRRAKRARTEWPLVRSYCLCRRPRTCAFRASGAVWQGIREAGDGADASQR